MYHLVFEDHFNQDGMPNAEYWHIETGGWGFGNQELQFYTNRSKNIYIENSLLHLVAHKEIYENCEYTSGKITTANKINMLYGKLEVRAKVPKGAGTWPAIWMLGSSIKEGIKWPDCGEIDVMEYVGREPQLVHFTLHTKSFNHRYDNHITHHSIIKNLSNDFHVYQMIWQPDSITFLVNDIKQVTFYKGDKVAPDGWPYHQPHYLLLNLAIGGTLGKTVDDDIFPATFLIDYVKIYEKK